VKDPRDVIIKPVVSEKSYSLLDANTYTFIVHPDANKTEIKEAVQAIFSVRVTSVNTLHRKGKRKRTRRASGVIVGVRKATKRALVTLHPDDKIEIFEAK
jgi:large subunit ribosomal protein L23